MTRRGARTQRYDRHPFAASQGGLYAQVSVLLTKLSQGGITLEMFSNYAAIVPDRKFEADVAIPDLKIACEYQGGLFMANRGAHQGVKGSRRDWFKGNEAQLNGWLFLQFGPDETRSGDAMNVVERAILKRIVPKRCPACGRSAEEGGPCED